jgi:hypothetical protein
MKNYKALYEKQKEVIKLLKKIPYHIYKSIEDHEKDELKLDQLIDEIDKLQSLEAGKKEESTDKFKEFVKMIANSDAELLAPGFKREANRLLNKKYDDIHREMDTNSTNYNNIVF